MKLPKLYRWSTPNWEYHTYKPKKGYGVNIWGYNHNWCIGVGWAWYGLGREVVTVNDIIQGVTYSLGCCKYLRVAEVNQCQ